MLGSMISEINIRFIKDCFEFMSRSRDFSWHRISTKMNRNYPT